MSNEWDSARVRREETGASENRERRYEDGGGVIWRAYERRRPGQRPALVFESAGAVRLVRDYPENWYTLPVRALEALSWCV
jgi:hypothetical protein